MALLCHVCVQGNTGRLKGVEGVQEGSVAPAGKKTLETLGAADSIAEALEMAANEQKRHEVRHMPLGCTTCSLHCMMTHPCP